MSLCDQSILNEPTPYGQEVSIVRLNALLERTAYVGDPDPDYIGKKTIGMA